MRFRRVKWRAANLRPRVSSTWLPFPNGRIPLAAQEAQADPKPPAGPTTDVGLEELNRLRTTGKITDAENQDLQRRLEERRRQQ